LADVLLWCLPVAHLVFAIGTVWVGL